MTQLYAPISYAAAAVALVDNLMTRLKVNGVLTEAERQQIVTDSIAGVASSPDPKVHGAADLLRAMYNRPFGM
jgi:hypothetical protein